MAGANLIYGLGMFESGVTMSYGQLVMDNEFAAMIKHVVRGIAVNDETLAIDVLREVGAFGDFLSHDHTFRHMRTDQTHPELIDRRIREEWELGEHKDIYARAWDKARSILQSHTPEPLAPEIRQALRDIVTETEDALGLKKR